MDDRLESWTAAAVNVLYAVALLAMALGALPQLREPLAGAWRAQVYAWRRGRWLGGRTRPPAWTTLLAREDLPQEQA